MGIRARLTFLAGLIAAGSIVPLTAANATPAAPSTCAPGVGPTWVCPQAVPHYFVTKGTPEQVWHLSWVNPVYLKAGQCPQAQQPGHIVDRVYSWLGSGWLDAIRRMEMPGLK